MNSGKRFGLRRQNFKPPDEPSPFALLTLKFFPQPSDSSGVALRREAWWTRTFILNNSASRRTVSYLRRLKSDLALARPPVARAKADGQAAAPAIEWKERRQSPRLRCSRSAEFHVADNDVRMWGTLTEVSLHGCYVEMNTTLPVGTRVDLVLKSFGTRVHSFGTVRAAYSFLGMGIGFHDIDIDEHQRLQQLVAALAGQKKICTESSG